MKVTKQRKAELVKEYGGDARNSGAVEVQIAILTEEIETLTKHLLAHKKDNISKRGLFMKVSHRKALLNYLQRSDVEKARGLAKKLGIRF